MESKFFDRLIYESESICKNRTKLINYTGKKGNYQIHIFAFPKGKIIGSVNLNENRLTGLFTTQNPNVFKGDNINLENQTKDDLLFCKEKDNPKNITILQGDNKPLKKAVNYAI